MQWKKVNNEWFSEDNKYRVEETRDKAYFCYVQTTGDRYNFIGSRLTPEDARLFCEVHGGKL